jgi:hypothetical protein
MMPVFRLLNMAEEIARYKKVNARRSEKRWLLKVRAGEFSYEGLLKEAEEGIQLIDDLFKKSDPPEQPDHEAADGLLVQIREVIYTQ